jgi:hypothetical protein
METAEAFDALPSRSVIGAKIRIFRWLASCS